VNGVGERGLPRALDAQALQVDVARHEVAVALEALALREQHAVLRDHQVPAEHDVGRRLVDAGVGVHVRGERPARLLAYELAAILGFPHEVVRRRRVQDHRRPRHGVARARRDRRPEVLADLDGERHARLVAQLEQQVGPEGSGLPREPHVCFARLARGREPALLVVLLVARQKRLGHDAQDAPALQHGRGVEEPVALQHRQTDDQDHRPRLRLAQQPLERALGAGYERRQAEEEVPARVAGEPELGQHQHLRAFVGRLAHELEHRVDVSFRVGDVDGRTGCRHAEEAERGGGHA
jgi:hypothetical protein